MEGLSRKNEIIRVTWIGSVVNMLLLIFKFVAGILGHSVAMIADAIHSLSDFITDIIVYVFVNISDKPKDEDHNYGHGKYETLATALIGIILLGVGVAMCINGCITVFGSLKGEPLERPRMLALVAAIVSIVVKEGLYQYTAYKGKTLNSKTVTANAWHHRSDALSSIGTLIGIGGAIFLGERWRILDPLTAIVVSVIIVKVAIELVKPCLDELLEKSLPREVEAKIREIVLSVQGVSSPHNLRTRCIGNHIAIEMHIRMDGNTPLFEAHAIASEIERLLKAEFGQETHIGIHMEPIRSDK